MRETELRCNTSIIGCSLCVWSIRRIFSMFCPQKPNYGSMANPVFSINELKKAAKSIRFLYLKMATARIEPITLIRDETMLASVPLTTAAVS